jgi:hypothetical protein
MFTRPLGTVSAPCLLAFVHNSLIVITKGSAAAGLIRIGVGWIRNCSRLGVSKGSIAVFNNSGSIAPAQLVRRSRSWTRPNAPNRAEIASPACGKSTAVRRLWLVIDCTIAKVFFTLWCNSSNMSRCSFSALSRLAASVAACSRSLRRVAFSSSSLKSPSLISTKPASWGINIAKQARGRYFRRTLIGNPSLVAGVDAMPAHPPKIRIERADWIWLWGSRATHQPANRRPDAKSAPNENRVEEA